jgi:hypothetical protein
MEQDGKEFALASDAMLQQAADGNLVLWAFTRRHAAKLRAFPWAVAPTQAARSCAAVLVPTRPELANELLGFPCATLKCYLATDPTDGLESHPWKDHYWVLDEPQAVTRELVYFQVATVVPAVTDDVTHDFSRQPQDSPPAATIHHHAGTAQVWTPERKTEARAMMTDKKQRGIRAYAAETAAAYKVTPTRLREVLNGRPKKRLTKHWPT